MSECREERSEDVVGRGGDDDGGSGRRGGGDCRKKTKQRGHVCGGGDRRKAKSSLLFRFGKVEKLAPRKNKRAANPSSPGCFGRGLGGASAGAGGGGGGGGCCRCFKQTPTVDSPVESQTSDPNSPEFTYELLRALIEKNDFYSKECNPHLDRGDNSGN